MANAISLVHLDSDVEYMKEQLTEVQFGDYLANLKGTKVNWRGEVLQVTRVINSDKYSVFISPNDGFIYLSFYIFGKQHALILNKNQEYEFSGEIVAAYKNIFREGVIDVDINITEYK
jgi:hypothetical protein